MKRRLDDAAEAGDAPPAALPADMAQLVAAMVAKELVGSLAGRGRFGAVGFAAAEEQSVNTFLHQKLGKNHLTRRPGPGGTRLTYIESCKAIELANLAFGFNGWSCRVLECKEEYRHQKAERWYIGFSSHVRIELKDGTCHEDFGFGQADGQRDIGAAIEQAKKASISDARKRALRLFGEYLGNSCYDREHIKEVHSSRPPVTTNAASPAEIAERSAAAATAVANGGAAASPAASGQQQAAQPAASPLQPRPQPMQTPPRTAFNAPNSAPPPRHNASAAMPASPFAQPNGNGAVAAPPSGVPATIAARISAMQAASDQNKRQAVATALGAPTAVRVGQQPGHPQPQQQQQQYQQPLQHVQPNQHPQLLQQHQQPPPQQQQQQPPQQQQQQQQPPQQQQQQQPPQQQQQQQPPRQQGTQQQQQWGAQQHQVPQHRVNQPHAGLPNQQAPPAPAIAVSPFGQPHQYPRQPLHTVGMNAPPPTRMGAFPAQHSSPIIKTEVPGAGLPRAGGATEYDINDLSLSQFDFDPQR